MAGQIRKYKRENFNSVSCILEEEIPKSHTFLSDEELIKDINNVKKELCQERTTEYAIKAWVIFEDQKIVGFTSVREYPTNTKIVSLYVSAAYRGKGYGKKLLNKVFSECKAPYSLAVYKENQNAYDFYVHLGFHVEKESMEANHIYLVMVLTSHNKKLSLALE